MRYECCFVFLPLVHAIHGHRGGLCEMFQPLQVEPPEFLSLLLRCWKSIATIQYKKNFAIFCDSVFRYCDTPHLETRVEEWKTNEADNFSTDTHATLEVDQNRMGVVSPLAITRLSAAVFSDAAAGVCV